MGIFLIIFALFVSLLEGAIFSVPLTLIVLLCLMLRVKKSWVFALGIVLGIVLDLLLFRDVGSTSLFFSAFLLLVLLYERKFSIATYPFVLASSGAFGILYALLFGGVNIFAVCFLSIGFAGLLFFVTSFFVFRETESKLSVNI